MKRVEVEFGEHGHIDSTVRIDGEERKNIRGIEVLVVTVDEHGGEHAERHTVAVPGCDMRAQVLEPLESVVMDDRGQALIRKAVLLATDPETYLKGLQIDKALSEARLEALLGLPAYGSELGEYVGLKAEVEVLEKMLAEAAAKKQAERERGVPEPTVKPVPLGTIQEGVNP